jgi:hypothetical protein
MFKFALPQTPTDSIEGSGPVNDNPIHLPGIKADHFRAFLRTLYPLCVLLILSVTKYWRVYDKFLQHGPDACRRI